MNKAVIVIIIIIIIAGGAFFYVKKQYTPAPQVQTPKVETQTAPTTAQESPAVTQNTVTLTADGYSPKTLTIKAGTTVTWVNNSGDVATVNSDPHPVHTDFSPLNLGNFSNGSKVTLTFNKTGTYGYHNHLNPSQKGTIIVR
jgi:plastocyanin